MSDFRVEFINEQSKLTRLGDRLAAIPVIAVDIETVDWWNRHQERVALIQIAYRAGSEIKVAIIDALTLANLEPLRLSLQQKETLKVIHNAAFDATRLAGHYQFQVAPIHDTMVAARLNREKRYSLQAQAAAHLNLFLDKGAQRSDWSRRPLTVQQLHYAASDAAATLRLFEHQAARNLFGNYRLRGSLSIEQPQLPLDSDPAIIITETQNIRRSGGFAAEENKTLPVRKSSDEKDTSLTSLALLGIIAELPNRYGPEQLMVSVGTEQRVGLAGWIVDRTLGVETDFDQETAKIAVAELWERKLITTTLTGRFEATTSGANLWRKLKTIAKEE